VIVLRPRFWVALCVAAAGCGDNLPSEGPDAPAADARVADAPAVDAPSIDAITIDAPIDAPTIDAPAIDAPDIDAPAIDAPELDAPDIDAPTTMIDAAEIDAGVIDASPVDAPGPLCGNGVVEGAEHCDLGLGNSDAPGSLCTTMCTGLWTFVSLPDFLGYDIGDLSALTGAVNSTNAFHDQAIDAVLDAVAAEQPDFVLVAGNLVGGNWYSDLDGVGVFGPVGSIAEKEAAIGRAGDVYYPQWLARFAARGIPVHAAVGENDLGRAPWPPTFDKAQLVDELKSVWGEHLTRLPGGLPRYADRPVGTPYEGTAYAFRHKNMLVVSADVFRFEAGADLGAQGSVAIDVGADQLAWMNQVFTAAAADPAIEYLVVQGNVPVIKPVRFQASGNLGLEGGATSPFWQALAAAGVDLYLSGNVHAMSAKRADGVEQVSAGGLLGSPQARHLSYLVGRVYPDRMELELKWVDVTYNAANTTLLWQTGMERPRAEYALDASGFSSAGTMVIDHAGTTPAVRDRTGFFLPFSERPPEGLMVHLPFDGAQNGRTANLGFSAAVNRGTLSGGTFAAGKLGDGLTLASNDRVLAGAPPLSGTWARTVAVWVRPVTPANNLQTVLTFGSNSTGQKWDVDIDFVNGGVLELGVAGGRTSGVGTPSLADGAWHHVAMVLPQGADSLDEVKMYVDGAPVTPMTAPTTVINTAPELPDLAGNSRQLIFGHAANGVGVQPYVGQLDDAAIWSRGLTAVEIRAVVSLANTAGLAYHAGQADALLAAFAAHTGVAINGRTWTYRASGLTGAEGVVTAPTPGTFELNLGGGAGFVSP
jgi:hypothetical protein